MPRQSTPIFGSRGMGRGPDVTSTPEHDDSDPNDSVVRMFTCGKGRESSSKSCQPSALYRGM